MFNPCARFEAKYLSGFKQKGVTVFVLQSYDPCNQPGTKSQPAYLLSHYNDMKTAVNHMDAIEYDPNRRLLKIDDPEDMKELKRMAQTGYGKQVYMSLKIPDAEAKAKKVLDKKLRVYIDYTLGWRIPAYDTVEFSIEFIFGEIYGVFKHGGRYHKVKMELIENNTASCVMTSHIG